MTRTFDKRYRGDHPWFADEDEGEDEPTFCGNHGRRCFNVFGHCDYHVDMGDAEYHARVDRELERKG